MKNYAIMILICLVETMIYFSRLTNPTKCFLLYVITVGYLLFSVFSELKKMK